MCELYTNRNLNPTRDPEWSRVNSELGRSGPKPILNPLGICKPVTHTLQTFPHFHQHPHHSLITLSH
ncbi:hypothetical protein HanPSC8_Chr16g0694281 [Helianthus annuus]|nr:hypothetical protein HanPSC8_Chr16g0694281 [Helianthus annuus]